MTEPSRDYSWPPFAPGHTLSLRHGAHSARVVGPLADRLAAYVLDVAPWTASPPFAAVVSAWAWAEARAELLRHFLDEHGLLDGDGDERAASRALDRAESRAAALRGELGLTPASLVKLLAGMSAISAAAAQDGLEALKAAGRELRLAAEQRAIAPAPDALASSDASPIDQTSEEPTP